MVFNFLKQLHFAQPEFGWIGLLLPLFILIYFRRSATVQPALLLGSLVAVQGARSWRNLLVHVPFVLRVLLMSCLIVALMRPQFRNEFTETTGEGIDLVLCLDVSGSMTAQDFQPNRLEASKKVAAGFIEARPADRIGVVIFAGESFTQCPLTTDRAALRKSVEQIHNGALEDGTSIGDGLATSIQRLRLSKSKSKVVILLTDGINNGGLIGPSNAMEMARGFGIRVYTIGVGTEGYAPFPTSTTTGIVLKQEKVSIDEKLLREMAQITGGRYYRATDNATLEAVYHEIDQLEKTSILQNRRTIVTEKYPPFLVLAIVFLLTELLIRFVVLRRNW